MTTDGLTLTRSFAVPRELVLDARPGGTWKAQMDLPGGRTIHWVGEYLEVVRPERLVQTIGDDPSSDERELVTILLSEAPGGTEMTFSQTGGHLTPEQYEQTRAGCVGLALGDGEAEWGPTCHNRPAGAPATGTSSHPRIMVRSYDRPRSPKRAVAGLPGE